jgi:hypothetical protein
VISERKKPWRIYKTPFLILVISLSGLASALLLDGPPDIVASIMVATPLLVVARLHPSMTGSA